MIFTGDPLGAAVAELAGADESLLEDGAWLLVLLLEQAASAIMAIATAPAAPPLRSVRRDLIGLPFIDTERIPGLDATEALDGAPRDGRLVQLTSRMTRTWTDFN
jgi:hypothetical protein